MTESTVQEDVRDARPLMLVVAMVALYLVVFGTLTWRHQSNYGTFGFDHGIFDQEVWLASRFKDPFLTTRGLNMWANHVNPIVYLLVPFYWMGAGPHFLYLVQTLAFASGAIPLWLIARDRFDNEWLALTLPAAWLLYPSLQWMTWWHFHPECFAVPALLFAWYFADKQRWIPYAICVVLVVAVKEDAALVGIALGIIVAIRKDRRVGLITAGLSLLWLLICLKLIIPHAVGASNPFYAQQFGALGNSTNEIVYNALRHPSRVIELANEHTRRAYYGQMLLPVGGLALLAPHVLALALPTLLVNIVNGQGYTHSYKYQYSAIVSVAVFLAVVNAIARFRQPGIRRFLCGGLCACALATSLLWAPLPLNPRVFKSGIWARMSSPHLDSVDAAVHEVPGDAGVAASYTIVPHLTHRAVIYEWPNPWVRSYYGIDGQEPKRWDPAKVDYLVLDAGLNETMRPLLDQLIGPDGEFRLLNDGEGVIFAKRTRPPRTGRGRVVFPVPVMTTTTTTPTPTP
ncbi:MAG TPA: DUF2079 domain-containing protein [Acidimicrobiales bacterium]|nr:DUF2079 domain-containing protein [Acidimicrobiales bacterium]